MASLNCCNLSTQWAIEKDNLYEPCKFKKIVDNSGTCQNFSINFMKSHHKQLGTTLDLNHTEQKQIDQCELHQRDHFKAWHQATLFCSNTPRIAQKYADMYEEKCQFIPIPRYLIIASAINSRVHYVGNLIGQTSQKPNVRTFDIQTHFSLILPCRISSIKVPISIFHEEIDSIFQEVLSF